ncbi:hypothetical protein [Oceanibium sediminis]|uniref:hypothetical protein n=1 Tax=Oceanibium sediminis TaxID=2026339 RepID=UPI000DD4B5E2|nr:hypothetical protein [Oceanibium sediminis]
MELIADGLLIAAALTTALYCFVLSRRLAALKALDKGLGGAIAGLSTRVDQTRESLGDMRKVARELTTLTSQAELAAGRLELLLATTEHVAAEGRAAQAEKPEEEPAQPPESDPTESDVPDIVSALREIAASGRARTGRV